MFSDCPVVLDEFSAPASQCTFWCRVLTDQDGTYIDMGDGGESQCTFWCRVLTDSRLCKPRRSTVYSTVIATGDPCTLTHR